MSFTVGQLVQIGTKDHLPLNHLTPIPGRVVCNKFMSSRGLPILIAFLDTNTPEDEQLKQYSDEGLCYLATRNNGSMYKEQNLYPRNMEDFRVNKEDV